MTSQNTPDGNAPETTGLRRFLGQPVVHFFALATAIYALNYWLGEEAEQHEAPQITVTQGQIEWMAATWESRWTRPPTKAELQRLVDHHVRETVLYREALAMGLDKEDVVIRRRLAQKIEFLTADLQTIPEPTDAELIAFMEENPEHYAGEDRISFAQVFFDPDQRGDATLADAEAAKAELIAMGQVPQDLAGFGDAFFLETTFDGRPKSQIRKLFGSGFTDPLFGLEQGSWQGPVLSGYGTHLVYVRGVETAVLPALDTVRDKVEKDWADAKRDEMNAQFIDNLISRYDVVVEPFPELQLTADGNEGS